MTGQLSRQDVPGLVVVRGAGDIATGVIQKIVRAGFTVVALEAANPSAIRWRAALCPAVTRGRWQVEDLTAVRAADWGQTRQLLVDWAGPGHLVPVLVDPSAELLNAIRPLGVVDAILAKRNLGTHRAMAPVTIGCGPGFSAGDDVDLVVETMRGHQLGRVITSGPAQPNTGVPGVIAGRAAERVLRSPAAGVVEVLHGIGEIVNEGDVIARVHQGANSVDVPASLDGVIRGMIPDGFRVPQRFKIADIDPRLEMAGCCDTISDKSRSVGGAVLEALLMGLVGQGLCKPQECRPR